MIYIIKEEFGKVEYTVKDRNESKHDSEMNTFQISGNIKEDGLLIDIQVFKTRDDFLKYYNDKNQIVEYCTVKALIDTGAEISSLSNEFVEKLHLLKTTCDSKTNSIGFGNQVMENEKYECVLYHPIFKNRAIPMKIINNTFTVQPYNAILGRDFLADFTLIYDGWSNSFRLINVNV